jgi:uncharacterized membrane protein
VGKTGSQCQYQRFRTIEALPGDRDLEITALSRDGSTVIGYSGDQSHSKAFRFDVASGTFSVIDPPSAELCTATAVNGDGTFIAGHCGVDRADFFHWTPAGTERFPSTLGIQLIEAVSADGQILAGRLNRKGVGVAWRFTPAGDLLTGSSLGSKNGRQLSADGSVALVRPATQFFDETPYRWTEALGFQLLPYPGDAILGSSQLTAEALCSDGKTIVGISQLADQYVTADFGVRWRGLVRDDLGLYSSPRACNYDGSVIASNDQLLMNIEKTTWDEVPNAGIHTATQAHYDRYSVRSLIGHTPGLPCSGIFPLFMSDDAKVLAGFSYRRGGWVAHLPQE